MGDPQVTMGLNTAYIIMVHIILDDKCLQNRKTQFFLLIIYTIYIYIIYIHLVCHIFSEKNDKFNQHKLAFTLTSPHAEGNLIRQ